MKRINFFSCIIIFPFLVLISSCSQEIKLNPDTWFHIDIDKISDVKKNTVQKFTCGETSSNLNKKFSYKVKNSSKLHYFFFCKPTAEGKALSMKIYHEDRRVQQLDSVASELVQDNVEHKIDSWLMDYNKDGYLDIITNKYSSGESTNGSLEILIWNKSKKAMLKLILNDKDEEKFKNKFKAN